MFGFLERQIDVAPLNLYYYLFTLLTLFTMIEDGGPGERGFGLYLQQYEPSPHPHPLLQLCG